MVLVVDDEVAIRSAVRDILELIDIETLEAPNGEEALAIYREHSHEIEAVLLDVQLPRMSGEEVFHALRKADDSLPIILSSGFDDSDVSATIRSDPATSFLRKPYAVDSLLAAVEAATS